MVEGSLVRIRLRLPDSKSPNLKIGAFFVRELWAVEELIVGPMMIKHKGIHSKVYSNSRKPLLKVVFYL